MSISLPEDLVTLILNDLAGPQEDWMTDEIAAAIDEGEASGYSDRTIEEVLPSEGEFNAR